MAGPIIIHRQDGFQSYLVLTAANPRELLRHRGFQDEFKIRPWLGSMDPEDAREEWCTLLVEYLDCYSIAAADNREYCLDCSCWDKNA